jgi:hypothetical protein
LKVLLDENLDHALRMLLIPHEAYTVSHLGWSGIQNGALLAAAEGAHIDVLLTGDQTLRYEQNLLGRRLAIVTLSTIRLPMSKENLPTIVAALDRATPGSFQAIECGSFTRKRNPKS